MKNKKLIYLLPLVCGWALFIYWLAWAFGPGSYPYAEVYEFNLPEEKLIRIIEEVKAEHPEIKIPQITYSPNEQASFLEDGRGDASHYWYHIYFYYPDKGQIVHTWTRPVTKVSTKFAFVAVNKGLELGNWETVNGSFWWWKNAPLKDEFEEKILKKIEQKVNDYENSEAK